MAITPELIISGVVGVLLFFTALGAYIKQFKQAPPPLPPGVAGVGGGFVDREQMERLIHEVKRIADAATDKNAAQMNDKLEKLSETLDKMQVPPARRR